jgi:poly-D-alanine transfer protein DltD
VTGHSQALLLLNVRDQFSHTYKTTSKIVVSIFSPLWFSIVGMINYHKLLRFSKTIFNIVICYQSQNSSMLELFKAFLCLKPEYRHYQLVMQTFISSKIYLTLFSTCVWYSYKKKKQTNSRALVRQRTIPTKRPPLVGEVSANFSG